jgi:hypothetical protein
MARRARGDDAGLHRQVLLPIRCPGKCDGGAVEQRELYNMLSDQWWVRYLMIERAQVRA